MSKLPKPHKKIMLPSREALALLTKGGAQAQSLGNYAKLTPSGAGAPSTYDQIMALEKAALSLKSR